MSAVAPLEDIFAEAERLLAAADAEGVPLRLIGGVAIWFHTDHVHPALARPYGDIDFATTRSEGRRVADLIARTGYEPAKEFNALNGSRRLLFYDVAHERKLDVFVGSFEMSHTIPTHNRIFGPRGTAGSFSRSLNSNTRFGRRSASSFAATLRPARINAATATT